MNSKIKLQLEGLTCGSCVGRAERALQGVDGVENVAVNLADETAAFTIDDAGHLPDAMRALSEAGYPAKQDQTVLEIDGMSCASCVGRIEKLLQQSPGVTDVAVSLVTESANITFVTGATTADTLAYVVTGAGYPARPQQQEVAAQDDRKVDQAANLSRQTLFALALTLPVFILEMGSHLFTAMHHLVVRTMGLQTSWVIQFVLITAVLGGPGRVFFAKGIPALLRRAPDMNALVALGTAAAWGFSTVATFAPQWLPDGTQAVYFEAAGVIVTLILLGRWLEARAKGRSGDAIRKLVGLRPQSALVVKDEDVAERSIAEIAVGDIVRVRPGERIATDGIVTDGASYVDESMLSGEPIPIEKGLGATVTGGTINGQGSIDFQVTRTGDDTTLAQIIQMVTDAQGAKLPIQNLVNVITMWFVPAVLLIAALTVAAWLIFGPDPALGLALVCGVAVLIVACPCAMGLATPTSIMVGTGRAAELGVLFRRGDALQSLQNVGVVAFDKTGTLTAGRPELTTFVTNENQDADRILQIIASAEARSEHPIAQAIVRAAAEKGLETQAVTQFESLTGMGLSAQVDGQTVLIGADRLFAAQNIDTATFAKQAGVIAIEGQTPLFASVDGQLAALIGVSDPIKPQTPAAIAALHAMGKQVAMITGDNAGTAQAIAVKLGIDHVVAEVMPDQKVLAIKDLQSGAQSVAFVGDGINDAPALAAADVGIAIGTGTDVAIESADVVLMSGDVSGVSNAFTISQHTMRNIRQNLFWAFAYNAALIPIAAGALYIFGGPLLSPMFAAGAMALSSLFVLSNALRLRWVGGRQSNAGAIQ